MKRSVFSVFLTFVMILLLGYCLVSIYTLHGEIDTLKSLNKELQQEEPEEEIEVAEVMTHFHRHAGKLDVAIQNENLELASFYLHELEEAGEVFDEQEVIDEEINLSSLYKTLLRPNLVTLDEAIDGKDLLAAGKAMQAIWSSCNTCHTASNHAFIVVESDGKDVGYPNQNFRVNTAK